MPSEIERLREFIRYWSYCTRQGLQRYCPEKYQEWLEDMRELCPAGVVELGLVEMMQDAVADWTEEENPVL